MTEEMYVKLSEALQGTDYEEIISDDNHFKELTKFFEMVDIESGITVFSGWYCGYLNITITEDGDVVYIADYLRGTAETY